MAPAAQALARMPVQARTMWSPASGAREANTLSGAPGRSSKEGCMGTGSE